MAFAASNVVNPKATDKQSYRAAAHFDSKEDLLASGIENLRASLKQRQRQVIAGEKPLLISEFGANTIEAGDEGQARLVHDSWQELLQAGAAGGIVFEFADEWWKNYDNPARSGDWWTRVPAPDDELRQDQDPEEPTS